MAFWQEKFRRNVGRDARAQAALDACGWRSFVVWECEIRNANLLMIRLRAFLGDQWRAGSAVRAEIIARKIIASWPRLRRFLQSHSTV